MRRRSYHPSIQSRLSQVTALLIPICLQCCTHHVSSQTDLGESDDIEDGPSTHEAIDMLLAANNMEVHVNDYAKMKKEKELGMLLQSINNSPY